MGTHKLWWALLAVALLAGCAETPMLLRYEVPVDGAQVWPAAPETPRYRYVGQLTGEQDFVVDESKNGPNSGVGDFFRWLVGLGQEHHKPDVLQRPQTGVTDADGRVYVTDVSRQAVFVFDQPAGKLHIWQQAGPNQTFLTPVGIALGPNNTLLVADAELGVVVQLDHDGKPLKSFGKGLLQRPTGLARDAVEGRTYVADTHGHVVKVFDDEGGVTEVIGKRGEALGEFNSPTHVAFVNNKLYVSDTFNTRVQVLDRKGGVQGHFGRLGTNVGDLVRPKGVTADSQGNIYVIESLNDHLLVYNSAGEFLLPIGGSGPEIGQFYLPSGVWSDAKDRIYVSDMFNGRIVILQFLGGATAQTR